MNGSRASDREIMLVRELLRSMSSGRQVYALYPGGHPKRLQIARELRDLVYELREQRPAAPVLFATDGNFYLGPTLLAWESLTLYRLGQSFAEAGVQSLEFLSGTTEEEMDALLRLLSGELDARRELSSVGVNRAGPGTSPEAAEATLSELLQSYAAGLDLLRQTAARLLAGRPADMDATVRLTEHLTTIIASDPAQALLLTTVKSYDEYTYHHMVNVCCLSLALARALGLSTDQAVSLGIGALLHDVGKVKVPADILQHDGGSTRSSGAWCSATRSTRRARADREPQRVPPRGRDGPRAPRGLRRLGLPVPVRPSLALAGGAHRRGRGLLRRRHQQAVVPKAGGAAAGAQPPPGGGGTRLRPPGRAHVRADGRHLSDRVPGAARLRGGRRGRPQSRSLLARPTVRLVLDAHANATDPEEIDLAAVNAVGEYRHAVVRSVDPNEIGIDMLSLLASGRFDVPPPSDTGPGLVHEPSPGERPPEGYVEAHEDPGALDLPPAPDAEAPPYD